MKAEHNIEALDAAIQMRQQMRQNQLEWLQMLCHCGHSRALHGSVGQHVGICRGGKGPMTLCCCPQFKGGHRKWNGEEGVKGEHGIQCEFQTT